MTVSFIGLLLLSMGTLMSCGDNAQPPSDANENNRTSQAANGGVVADEEAAAPDDLVVEETKIVYLPESTGGNFHTVTVVLENPTDQVAIDVGGQISILQDGTLIESLNPTQVNILPGAKGVFVELVDLSEPVKNGELEVQLTVERFQDGPSESPVSFSNLRYKEDEYSGCEISGTVSNEFSEQKTDLQLRVVWYAGSELISSSFTYVDTVFPGTDATFELTAYGRDECSDDIDRIEVHPNLGEDKIFNP